MNDRAFLQVQVTELRQLLEDAGDDPILKTQLEQRLEDVEEQLRVAEQPNGVLFPPDESPLPRAALFLMGGGVEASEGIRAALAGECLVQYEKMFTQQALHDEREAARTAGRQRRPRGSPTPSLLFTGTLRGSFGLQFVPFEPTDQSLVEVHTKSLNKISDALESISSSEQSLEEAVGGVAPGILGPMKQFLNVLAHHGTDLRLASSDAPPRLITNERIKLAAQRLEQEMEQKEITISGVFRGLTRESYVFDLVADDVGVITGSVDETLADEDLERIDALTNKKCKAQLERTTLKRADGSSRETYVLLDAVKQEG